MMNILNKSFLFLSILGTLSYAQQIDSVTEKKNTPGINSLHELRYQLDDYFSDRNFSDALWGVMVKSLRTGEVLYKRNEDKLFMPASDMKLFTSAASLILLGSSYSYETNFYVNGDLEKGVIKGDLIIHGSGDPTISNRFYEGNETVLFENWADSLKSKGIWVIDGSILGDDSEFDNEGYGKGWSQDYESSWFAAPSSALSYNDNCIEIKIEPSEINYPAKITLLPDTKFVTLISKVVTTDDNSQNSISARRLRGTNLISVTGNIKKNSMTVVEHISISDPTMYFLTVLKEVFARKGITVKGRAGGIESANKNISSDDLTLIYTHKSNSLGLIIKELNKNSNNFYAEQILKSIGLEEYNFGSVENGVKACKELYSSMGINPDNLVMADGSGLSRLNLVTPRQIVNLLSYMYKREEYTKFYESLPIAGVDGTLIDRMKKTVAENNVRAKAGYNTNVSSLSGYLKTISGEPLVFSIMVNNFLAPPALANYIQDNVCNRLINFNRN